MRLLTTFAAISLAALLAGCNAHTSSAPTTKAALADNELRDLTDAEKERISRGIAQGLKDPASAQFRWTKVPIPVLMPPAGEFYYCGLVNAKNSYGGYTGMKPFVAMVTVVKTYVVGANLVGVGSDGAGTYVVEKACAEQGLDPYRAI